MFQGDENGDIVVYDLTPIIHQVDDLVPFNIMETETGLPNLNRNPHREFVIEREERKKKGKAANDSDSDIDESMIPKDTNVLVPEN